MQEFQYSAPESLEEAARLLAEHGDQAVVLAGGTDILVQLREGHREAELVVDVKKIDELMAVGWDANRGLQLGASVPCWQVYGDERIDSAYPALTDATRIIGGWQIQSRASVGGNLCNSSPAADSIPALIVHGAVCHIVGPAGRRTLAAEEFCTGPGKNQLASGEMLVALTLPPPSPHSSSAYQRFIPRNEMDIAVAGAASWVQLDSTGKTIQQARVALAAVAPVPTLASEAGEWLAGKSADEGTFSEAGEIAKRVASPIDDMRGTAEYRRHLVGVLTKRTLAHAVERARGSK